MESQSALSKGSGINAANISRWLRDDGAPDLPNCRNLAPVLRVPMLAILVAAGHLTRDEAKLHDLPRAEPPRLATADALAEDNALSAEARRILLAAYTTASGHSSRRRGLTAVPEGVAASRRPAGPKRGEQEETSI